MRRGVARCLVFVFTVLALSVETPATAGFRPISAADSELQSVPWEPGAKAVILSKTGEFLMLDESRSRFSSSLRVEARVKILSDGVEDLGEIELLHSVDFELYDLQGRTVLPSGESLPLDDGAIFERTLSEKSSLYMTTLVFPRVTKGAILDYSYEIRFDSIFYLEPWFFQDRYPTLRSEVVYIVPKNVGIVSWGQNGRGSQVQRETERVATGTRIRAWVERAPSIPDEEFATPFEERSSRYLILPSSIVEAGFRTNLLEDWQTTSSIFMDYVYEPFWAKARRAKARAKELAGAKGTRSTLDNLFAFVRDEIETEAWSHLGPWRETADEVLDKGSGSSADKSLLLHKMLKTSGFDPELVWIADRNDGTIDTQVANTGWFDRPVVRVATQGQTLYLDPGSLAPPGYLPATAEGMPALLVDPKNPQVLSIPVTPASESGRDVELSLSIEVDGRLVGNGVARFTGHHAATVAAWGRSEDTWQEWLDERFGGLAVGEVTSTADLAANTAELRWTLRQRDEDVLGDELSLVPSRPLGPLRQPFVARTRRKSPVLLQYPDVDELRVRVAMPTGWEIEAVPEQVEFSNAAGSFQSAVSGGTGADELVYVRRFARSHREYPNAEAYDAIRELYAKGTANDGQPLVLSRP